MTADFGLIDQKTKRRKMKWTRHRTHSIMEQNLKSWNFWLGTYEFLCRLSFKSKSLKSIPRFEFPKRFVKKTLKNNGNIFMIKCKTACIGILYTFSSCIASRTTDTRWLYPWFFEAQIQFPIPNKHLGFR